MAPHKGKFCVFIGELTQIESWAYASRTVRNIYILYTNNKCDKWYNDKKSRSSLGLV